MSTAAQGQGSAGWSGASVRATPCPAGRLARAPFGCFGRVSRLPAAHHVPTQTLGGRRPIAQMLPRSQSTVRARRAAPRVQSVGWGGRWPTQCGIRARRGHPFSRESLKCTFFNRCFF